MDSAYFESDEFKDNLASLTALADRTTAARLRPIRPDKHGPPYLCRNEWCQGPLTASKLCWKCDTPEAAWWEGAVYCVVTLTGMGHRCGYCRLPDAHPWVGLDYDDLGPVLVDFDEEMLVEEAQDDLGVLPVFVAALSEDGVDKLARTPAGQIRVHGGVTYAGPLEFVHGVPAGWYFGFDCAHAGDSPEPDHPYTRRLRTLLNGSPDVPMATERLGTVKGREFVEFECKRMAAAIHAGLRNPKAKERA